MQGLKNFCSIEHVSQLTVDNRLLTVAGRSDTL